MVYPKRKNFYRAAWKEFGLFPGEWRSNFSKRFKGAFGIRASLPANLAPRPAALFEISGRNSFSLVDKDFSFPVVLSTLMVLQWG
jgi:hypothetical protein